MSPSRVANIEFDKFYNIIDGKQRGAASTRNGINPATKENLWEVSIWSQLYSDYVADKAND